MSTILAIDTASEEIALALAVDGEIVATSVSDGGRDHSRLLLPAIQAFLGGRQAELAGIGVVRGPGNYAGLRVGIATAHGLAFARGVPMRGISTMEAVANAHRVPSITVIHPAGRKEYAVQEFREGSAVGVLHARPGAALEGPSLAGEGAAALGGTEVRPEQRVRAALSAMLRQFDSRAGSPSVEALYLREPNITLPRRPLNARAG